jgi:hypothetical protein
VAKKVGDKRKACQKKRKEKKRKEKRAPTPLSFHPVPSN